MIPVRKLMGLSPGHRVRKAVQVLGRVEAALRAARAPGDARAEDAPALPARELAYAAELAGALLADGAVPADVREEAARGFPGFEAFSKESAPATMEEGYEAALRFVSTFRRNLEASAGLAPADWDFAEPLGLALLPGGRRVFPGMRAYLEDLRSPFNVGSAFRTADAFGLEELLLSPFCADPGHARAERSAMGAAAVVPWRRAGLGELAGLGEVFALELGGQEIEDFEFPARGVALLGSEELGVSPEALALCRRRVSIPMLGAKASLNAGVAFGILLAAWAADLRARGVAPLRPE